MKSKFTPQRYLWMILLAILVACTPLAPARTETPSATSVPSSTPTILPTETLTPSPQQPPACTFPLAQTTMTESTPEKYTFSEPKVVLTNPKDDVEIAQWLPDSQQALIVRTIIENQDTHYQSIELFDARKIKAQIYAKREGASYPPVWVTGLNVIIYPERKIVSFSRDENGMLIQNSVVLNQLLWISHGDPDTTEKLEDVQFKASDVPHEWVISSLVAKPDGSQIVYSENNGESISRLYIRSVSHDVLGAEQLLPFDAPQFKRGDYLLNYEMTWRPNTSQLFFYSSSSPSNQTILLDINSGKSCTLNFDGWVYFARWSPNGRYLAAITTRGPNSPIWVNYDLNVLDTLTGDLHKIDSNKIDPPDWAHVVSDLSWAPDNHHLAILGEGYAASTSPPPSIDRLYLVDFLSGEVDNLFPSYQFNIGWWGTGLAWSPDGSKLLTRCPTPEEGRLCFISVNRTVQP